MTVLDRAWQIVFWAGYRVMLLWWLIRRPSHNGALVAIWHGRRVLLIRQSYRNAWTFPGGSMEAGEAAHVAAARELAEEIGLRVTPDRLHLAHEGVYEVDYRRDHVRIFDLFLTAEPTLSLDNREIVGACFREPRAALELPLPPHVRGYLMGRL